MLNCDEYLQVPNGAAKVARQMERAMRSCNERAVTYEAAAAIRAEQYAHANAPTCTSSPLNASEPLDRTFVFSRAASAVFSAALLSSSAASAFVEALAILSDSSAVCRSYERRSMRISLASFALSFNALLLCLSCDRARASRSANSAWALAASSAAARSLSLSSQTALYVAMRSCCVVSCCVVSCCVVL